MFGEYLLHMRYGVRHYTEFKDAAGNTVTALRKLVMQSVRKGQAVKELKNSPIIEEMVQGIKKRGHSPQKKQHKEKREQGVRLLGGAENKLITVSGTRK